MTELGDWSLRILPCPRREEERSKVIFVLENLGRLELGILRTGGFTIGHWSWGYGLEHSHESSLVILK